MTPDYKPEGYNSVSVYIMADGAQRVLDFLVAVFDAKEARRFDGPDGRIMHTEVMIDDTVVMLSEGSDSFPAFPVWMHVYVPDVDATYRRALDRGAESVQEPVQKEGDPDRRGGFNDPAGNTWWVSQQQAAG